MKKNTLGYRLSEVRLDMGVAQADLARKIGKPPSTVCIFEWQDSPRVQSIRDYVEGLGLTATLTLKKNGDKFKEIDI